MLDYDLTGSNVITSDRVNGTAVYGADERRIGAIDHLVIDKVSGKIAYAVMSFGSFLELGEDYYPIPWSALQYDTRLQGYRTRITEDQLRNAPARNDDWYRDRKWEEHVHAHYGLPYYWM